RLDAGTAQIAAIEAAGRRQLIVLTSLIVVLGCLCSWTITRAITRPLSAAVVAARRVAEGDLAHAIEVNATDEVGQLLHALQGMNENLAKIVGEVRQGTDAMATASGQIAAGNQDLSSRTEEQASSLQQTAASMEQLTGTVKQNAENAR